MLRFTINILTLSIMAGAAQAATISFNFTPNPTQSYADGGAPIVGTISGLVEGDNLGVGLTASVTQAGNPLAIRSDYSFNNAVGGGTAFTVTNGQITYANASFLAPNIGNDSFTLRLGSPGAPSPLAYAPELRIDDYPDGYLVYRAANLQGGINYGSAPPPRIDFPLYYTFSFAPDPTRSSGNAGSIVSGRLDGLMPGVNSGAGVTATITQAADPLLIGRTFTFRQSLGGQAFIVGNGIVTFASAEFTSPNVGNDSFILRLGGPGYRLGRYYYSELRIDDYPDGYLVYRAYNPSGPTYYDGVYAQTSVPGPAAPFLLAFGAAALRLRRR